MALPSLNTLIIAQHQKRAASWCPIVFFFGAKKLQLIGLIQSQKLTTMSCQRLVKCFASVSSFFLSLEWYITCLVCILLYYFQCMCLSLYYMYVCISICHLHYSGDCIVRAQCQPDHDWGVVACQVHESFQWCRGKAENDAWLCLRALLVQRICPESHGQFKS